MLSNSSTVTNSVGLAVPTREMNAALPGTLANQIYDNKSILNTLNYDSEWKTIPLYSGFEAYVSHQSPSCRKIGKFVEITGAVKNNSEITSESSVSFAKLQSEFRPSINFRTLCQGSESNKWLLTVLSNGEMMIERYGTTSFANIKAGSWFPFHATFITS